MLVIENKSGKQGLFDLPKNAAKLENIANQTYDLKELCNGHDVLNILSLALEEAIANKKSSNKISGEDLEERLIIAYNSNDFKQTNLYDNLLKWEEDLPNGYSIK